MAFKLFDVYKDYIGWGDRYKEIPSVVNSGSKTGQRWKVALRLILGACFALAAAFLLSENYGFSRSQSISKLTSSKGSIMPNYPMFFLT